jgi:hypothetical protein
MINYTNSKIESLFIHFCGNKNDEENLRLSKKPIPLDDEMNSILSNYFISSFKNANFNTFTHHSDINFNEIYTYASKIFIDPDSIYLNSVNIAHHLYNQSIHPQIRGGELYVVYFTGCIVDEEEVDAIGIFKSENRETYLKVMPIGENYQLNTDLGINTHKLDKGCLIFDTESENGYKVCIIDNTNKGEEARYWKDDFLGVKPRNDSFHYTQNYMDLCKKFVSEKVPEEYEISKTDKIDLLNRSADFFKKKEHFDLNEFTNEVFQQPELIDTFKEFKSNFKTDSEVPIVDEFDISSKAVKKQAKIFKSVLKLDKNFHIYIHGNKEFIEKGLDEDKGMKFYKIYFKEEE